MGRQLNSRKRKKKGVKGEKAKEMEYRKRPSKRKLNDTENELNHKTETDK